MSKSKKVIFETVDALKQKSQKNLRGQSKRISSHNNQERVTLPQITASSEKLQTKINQLKAQQLSLKNTLEQAIQGNLKYRTSSASQLQKSRHIKIFEKKQRERQTSLVNLKTNFQKRIQFNNEANLKLQKMQQEIKLKKEAVAKRLSLIQAQNLQKINEIEEFEKNFVTQVKAQLSKNLEKQKSLKSQYERISRQESKAAKSKEHENKLDQETWRQITNLKLNLQGLMSKQKVRQNRLIEEKDVDRFKKQEKVQQQQNQKQQSKKTERKRVKLDPKEAGKQYLDFAKKRGSVGSKLPNKMKKNYLNINLKVINYDNPILQAISNNDGYLSKNTKIQQQNEQSSHQNFDYKADHTNISEAQHKNGLPNQFLNDVMPILQLNKQQAQNNSFYMEQRFD